MVTLVTTGNCLAAKLIENSSLCGLKWLRAYIHYGVFDGTIDVMVVQGGSLQ